MFFGKKTNFILNPSIKYDAFFENEELYRFLNVNKNNICIDFYGEKGNRGNKRFWLTREKRPYKIIKSFSLSYKPYEWNIINCYYGLEIFLYDTNVRTKNKFISTKRHFNLYMYNKDISFISSIKQFIYIFIKKCLAL